RSAMDRPGSRLARATGRGLPAVWLRPRAGRDEAPELLFVQQRDASAPGAQPFDLHQLEAAVAARGLQRIRPAAHDDRRLGRWRTVDDGAGAARGADRLAPRDAEDPGEGEVHAGERARDAR